MIVVNTNVVVSGLRSRKGASNALLNKMVNGSVAYALSPALILEYEDVLKRPGLLWDPPVLSTDEVDVVLDALCAMSVPVVPWFRFRPFLTTRRTITLSSAPWRPAPGLSSQVTRCSGMATFRRSASR